MIVEHATAEARSAAAALVGRSPAIIAMVNRSRVQQGLPAIRFLEPPPRRPIRMHWDERSTHPLRPKPSREQLVARAASIRERATKAIARLRTVR